MKMKLPSLICAVAYRLLFQRNLWIQTEGDTHLYTDAVSMVESARLSFT